MNDSWNYGILLLTLTRITNFVDDRNDKRNDRYEKSINRIDDTLSVIQTG